MIPVLIGLGVIPGIFHLVVILTSLFCSTKSEAPAVDHDEDEASEAMSLLCSGMSGAC